MEQEEVTITSLSGTAVPDQPREYRQMEGVPITFGTPSTHYNPCRTNSVRIIQTTTHIAILLQYPFLVIFGTKCLYLPPKPIKEDTMRTYRIGPLWTLLTCLLLLGSCHNNATLHRLPMAKVHKQVGLGKGKLQRQLTVVLPTAQKQVKNGPKVTSNGPNNFVLFVNFFKYPWIFHRVSADISSRIHGYFIKYPWIFYFFCTHALFFGQIGCNFRV